MFNQNQFETNGTHFLQECRFWPDFWSVFLFFLDPITSATPSAVTSYGWRETVIHMDSREQAYLPHACAFWGHSASNCFCFIQNHFEEYQFHRRLTQSKQPQLFMLRPSSLTENKGATVYFPNGIINSFHVPFHLIIVVFEDGRYQQVGLVYHVHRFIETEWQNDWLSLHMGSCHYHGHRSLLSDGFAIREYGESRERQTMVENRLAEVDPQNYLLSFKCTQAETMLLMEPKQLSRKLH